MKGHKYDPLKRTIDLVTASLLLLATAPVQVIVALLIRRNLGSPVLFCQERPGKDERIFKLVKFRTMIDPDPSRGLVSDKDRLTALGRLLRSTSLDELPTLWNVVKGDMSLVGPRPLLVHYLERYTEQERRRHEVRPGVTGLAQVSGRNTLTWEAKFSRDVEYVDGRGLTLDLKILAQTVLRVLRRDGISADGAATMPEFTGTGRRGD